MHLVWGRGGVENEGAPAVIAPRGPSCVTGQWSPGVQVTVMTRSVGCWRVSLKASALSCLALALGLEDSASCGPEFSDAHLTQPDCSCFVETCGPCAKKRKPKRRGPRRPSTTFWVRGVGESRVGGSSRCGRRRGFKSPLPGCAGSVTLDRPAVTSALWESVFSVQSGC